ncbi:MAG: fatty acid desaturase [Vicinamibacteria bacterium]
MTLTWNGRRFDWVIVAYFAVIHVIALTAFWHFSWTGFALALLGWWLAGSLGICFTYHRLLTHRGFRVPKAIEYLGTVFGLLASEGGAISWVAMHRIHHAKSDEPGKDIHTPRDGFWWSHMGWIVCDIGMERRAMERRWAPEMVADPVHRVLNRFHLVPNILVGLALYAWGGWSLVVWGVFVRLVLTVHGTWLVNSATHVWGYRTWHTTEDSRNLWWVGLLAWGEGWHNTHHAFPRSARHGFEWWELDATWLVIRALAAIGLVKDIQLFPKNAERFRIRTDLPEEAAAA